MWEVSSHYSALAGEAPSRAQVRALAPAPASIPLEFGVHRCIRSVRDFWLALEKEGTSSVYQRYEWASAAILTLEAARRAEPFIVTATAQGRPQMLLPLARTGGILSELRWIGGSHVNFNMGLYSRQFAQIAGPAEMAATLRFLRSASGGRTLLSLCSQIGEWDGAANPMAQLPCQRSANPVFFMDLSRGFEALLAAGNSKRKRKKFRQQRRAAEALGGYRLVRGDTGGEALFLLETFLEQKAARLRDLGVADVFAAPGAREMLASLAGNSAGASEPSLRLYGLEVGGRIRAVFGCGLRDGHLSGYFSSIGDDDFTQQSPGEMLLYLVVQEACAAGATSMDLGGGDERYKRSWCDSRVELFDVILPLGPAARPLAAARRAKAAARASIRENESFWNAIKSLRKWRGSLAAGDRKPD